jgi:type IV secretion system protein TrbL
LQIALKFVASISLWSPKASMGLFFTGLIILICFALIAAFMVMTLIESYIVISAGVLFMGFGGSRWTKDLALKIVMYAVSVGAKLFILHLMVALGMQVFASLGANVSTDNATLLGVIAVALVMLVLTWTVPDMVQSLINGTAFGNSGAMLSAMTAQTAQIAAGGAMAAHAAASLAGTQLQEAKKRGAAPTSSAGQAVWLVGQSAKNLGSAVVANEADRLSGRRPHGMRLAQSAERMRAQRTAILLQNEAGATPPSPPEAKPDDGRQAESEQSQGENRS